MNWGGATILNDKHGFNFRNHGTTTEKASYFLNHVDLGVIELKSFKIYKKVPVMEMIGQKLRRK